MMLRRFALASFLVIASSAAPAMAVTAGDDLDVTAKVVGTCTISTTALAFGSYDAAATTPNDATATVTTNCTAGVTAPTVTLGQGETPGAGSTDDAPLRQLVGPTATDLLSYNLYTDSAGGTVWGNTALTGVVLADGNGTDVETLIYGRIPTGQTAALGDYTDTVTATITY